jgi:hypothetical protein
MRSSDRATRSLLLVTVALLLAPVAWADRNGDYYSRGLAAVNRGDVAGARDAFCTVAPSYRDAAQQCTLYRSEASKTLRRYNQNFLEGVQLMQEGKLGQAEFKFRNVKAGDRVESAQRMLREIQKLRRDQLVTKTVNGDARVRAPIPSRTERSRIDESTSLAEAKRSIGRRDFVRARRILNAVNAQNFRNDEATSMLKSLPPEERGSSSVDEEDKALSAAIRDFYNGNFADAEARLRSYRLANPKKPGLGNFYLGVTLMTQFYLSAKPDPRSQMEAIKFFKEAHETQGFVPPESFISPKIMKAYRAANPELGS